MAKLDGDKMPFLEANMSIDDLREQLSKISKNTDNADRYDVTLQTLLQLRERDEDWLRSQPAAQVERLMAAGMSRAAALQALQSTGESPMVEGAIAGNVEQTETQRMQAISDIIMQSIQLVENVVQTGVSIGLAVPTIRTQVQQAKIARFQAEQMQIATSTARMDFDALTDVGNFLQAMQNYQSRTGNVLPADLNDTLKVMQAVAYDDMPDVYSLSHDRLQKAMENPRFYPALKKAHEEFSKGNYELSLDLLRQKADLHIAQYQPEVMFSEVAKNWQDVRTAQDINPSVVEELRSRSNLQSSQANMFKQEGRILKADADFWTESGGHNRKVLLRNQTAEQIYMARMRELGVQYQESFNETACTELWNELQVIKNLGPEYFDLRVKELMQNAEYRNAVLQANYYAMTRRTDNVNTWYGRFADWCSSYGVLGAAIDAAESFAGSTLMSGAIYEGHLMHAKGVQP